MSFLAKQLFRVDMQNLRQLLDRIERYRINLSLQRRHIGSIDARQVGKLLLGKPLLCPKAPQVGREGLPQGHARIQTTATTLHPRSILYIFTVIPNEEALTCSN